MSQPTLFGNPTSDYHWTFSLLPKIKMRVSLSATLLLSVLLAACASTRDIPPSKNISQSGPLKVNPSLLGQATPAESQAPQAATMSDPAATTATTAATALPKPAADNGAKATQADLRTQRTIYFDYKSAAVRSEFDPALLSHARYLAANPQSRVRIDGNADERGPADFNARLGLQRAENVRQALIDHGAPEKQISLKSLGEAQPKLKGHDEDSWTENRRADVIYEKEK